MNNPKTDPTKRKKLMELLTPSKTKKKLTEKDLFRDNKSKPKNNKKKIKSSKPKKKNIIISYSY